ncbi:dihydroorotase [Tepidimonas taiwanensis]|uniref:Dihydroorotase n=1 Tax=Tepidimonas taiwanensis TaxID=307486 RepID=A0A554X165_9BURK|nr:dihydroorotase [Tepidimonas taiwanensis]MCX7693652.1 dihydroorotase [Tepidimonas taiwanensis]TSE29601.1 Dihydroorotase [Tepidimonas taiwanensis]UBQ04807.1 dihydroorotase [Tepidimonas taiwanensis]
MKLLIRQGRVIDPASGTDRVADVAIAAGRIIGIGAVPADFAPNRVLDATGCWVLPGLVDLCVRLGEPGQEHAGMLESETAAAVAGGVTSLVCPPDTDPVLDEPGLVDMLKARAEKLHRARLFPLGALTRGLQGEVLAEMVQLTERGCVGFGQADRPIVNTQVLQRAFQYAATFGYSVWLRPEEPWLSKGVMASGPLATRLGLSGVPAASEVIALHTLFELLRGVVGRVAPPGTEPPVRLHLCRLSTAAGVALVRQAKAEGLPVTADVSVHQLMLTDTDIGYYDTRLRLQPPVRQQRDRDALRQGLADGTIDALVSDHTPVSADAKALPFAEAEPGATAVELLAALALKWAQQDGVPIARVVEVLTAGPARVLGARLGTLQASVGRLAVGGVADVCVLDPAHEWRVEPARLRSQGRHTPFEGHALPGRVRATLVGGHLAFDAGG